MWDGCDQPSNVETSLVEVFANGIRPVWVFEFPVAMKTEREEKRCMTHLLRSHEPCSQKSGMLM